MFNLFIRRPKEETLLKTMITNRKWLFQFIGVSVFLVLGIFGFFFITRDLPGELIVTSEPKFAHIYIDKKPTNKKTPERFTLVKPKSYLVEVKLDGYISKPFAKDVLINPGSSSTVHFRLLTPEQAAKETSVQPDTVKIQIEQPNGFAQLPIQKENDRLYPPPKSQSKPIISGRSGSGRIFVSSSIPNAEIFLNGESTSQTTDAILLVPTGTHQVQVVKQGYRSDPSEVTVLIGEAFQEQKIFFRLIPENTISSKVVSIRTTPIEGPILINNRQVGIGSWEGELKFGVYELDFGFVSGYSKPMPMKINVTATDPSQTIIGRYKVGYTCELRVDEFGQVIQTNIDRWSIGIHHPDVGGFVIDRARGPKIVKVKHWEKFAFEFGEAFASKSPVGGQFLEIEFTLPQRTPYDSPLYLWLQAVKSTKNYPLTFVNRTHGVIEVNQKVLRSEWSPSRMWNTTDPDGWERHPLGDRLVSGKNTIRIYSHDLNVRYFYVSAIRIGPQPEADE
ncbi:MAG: PEGA domain-containing protein [bacterium]|nr:PEGA domain-containing protein [bacterium]